MTPDPFVFVAATRYAINRTLTAASDLVAGQVQAHAAEIARDQGAAGAILNEIDEFLRQATPDLLHGPGELEATKDRWRAAYEALGEACNECREAV